MNPQDQRRGRVMISEDDDSPKHRRTRQARSQLYRLIAQFRKDADSAEDPSTQAIFEYAAETVAGLASAFKRFDDQIERQNTPDES